jgi:hypothetical protein
MDFTHENVMKYLEEHFTAYSTIAQDIPSVTSC